MDQDGVIEIDDVHQPVLSPLGFRERNHGEIMVVLLDNNLTVVWHFMVR